MSLQLQTFNDFDFLTFVFIMKWNIGNRKMNARTVESHTACCVLLSYVAGEIWK